MSTVTVNDEDELQNAIDGASMNETTTIFFGSGVTNIVILSSISISDKIIIIDGANGTVGNVTLNSSSNNFFDIGGTSDITLLNLNLVGDSDGIVSDDGGAIFNTAILRIRGCDFESNKVTWYGGAIYNEGSILTIEDSTFNGNSSSNSRGGAIYNEGNSMIIKNCTFVSNEANQSGGAIYNDAFTASTETYGTIITGSTFKVNKVANSTGTGTAIKNNDQGTMLLVNCTIDSNSGTTPSGAVGALHNDNLNQNSSPNRVVIINCTITDNYRFGVYSVDYTNNNSDTIIGNSVISNNRNGEVYKNVEGYVTDLGGNHMDATTEEDILDIMALNGGQTECRMPLDSVPGNPSFTSLLIDLGINTIVDEYFPQAGLTTPYTDQRGFDRIANGGVSYTVDIGSVEFNSQPICFAGKSKVLTKNIHTGQISYVRADQVYPSTHLIYNMQARQFVPFRLNAITGPTTRYVRIKADLLGVGKPNEDFNITSGHHILFNGVKTKARAIPGAKRIRVKPEKVYTFCTDNECIVNVNNLPVYTTEYAHWIKYSNEKKLSWSANKQKSTRTKLQIARDYILYGWYTLMHWMDQLLPGYFEQKID